MAVNLREQIPREIRIRRIRDPTDIRIPTMTEEDIIPMAVPPFTATRIKDIRIIKIQAVRDRTNECAKNA